MRFDFGVAVFAFVGGTDSSAEMMDDVLESVADAEDGEAEGEDGGIGGRRVSVVDGAGASGENDADGVVRLDFCRWRRCREGRRRRRFVRGCGER